MQQNTQSDREHRQLLEIHLVALEFQTLVDVKYLLASDLLGNTPYYFELSFHSQAMARVTSKEFRLHPRLIPQKM